MNHETAHKADIFSATGLVAGGVAGGLGGLLTGLGVLAVSGLGPIVAADLSQQLLEEPVLAEELEV